MTPDQTELSEILQWIMMFCGVGLTGWVFYCVKRVGLNSKHFWHCIFLLATCVFSLLGMYNYHFNFNWHDYNSLPILWWHPAIYMAGSYIGYQASVLKNKLKLDKIKQDKPDNTIDEILLDFRKVTADLQSKYNSVSTPIEILASYITHLPLPAWIKAADGKMMAINEKYTETYGITMNQYNSNIDAKNWGDPTAKRFKKHDDAVLATHEEVFAYEEIQNPVTKTYQRLEVVKFPIWDQGEVIAVAGLVKGFI